MPQVGYVREISRSEDAVDFQWRIAAIEIEPLKEGGLLNSPPLFFAGLIWRFSMECKEPSSSNCPLVQTEVVFSAPSVRYWLGAVKADGEREEEEIVRGTIEDCSKFSVKHQWLTFSELWRRMKRFAPSGTVSLFIRLRSGPETDDEMKSLVEREALTSNREAAAQNNNKTDFKDPETGRAAGSAVGQQETTRSDSEDILLLRENFKEMLLHGDDHDVILKVKEKEFKAHKSMLRARLPVFKAMFAHEMRESEEDKVTIEDVDPDCFAAFLTYIYTGEVEDLSATIAIRLYYAADKYHIPALKRRCMDVLKASLSTTLVCDVLTLALTHEEDELLDSAMDYVTEYLVQVMETVEWQRFVLRNPIQANEVSLKAIKRRQNSNPQ